MKYILFIIIGFITYLFVEILSTNVGYAIGAGPGDIGLVVTAISILCGIVVVCTCIIVDAIRDIKIK